MKLLFSEDDNVNAYHKVRLGTNTQTAVSTGHVGSDRTHANKLITLRLHFVNASLQLVGCLVGTVFSRQMSVKRKNFVLHNK